MDKLDLIVDKIETLDKTQTQRLDSIDANLTEHMRRTDVLESLHKDNQIRIQKLEEPSKALKLIKSTGLWISAVLGAVYVIIKLWSHF